MQKMSKVKAVFLIGLLVPSLFFSVAWGAEKFPDRPITVIVPYGAGGDTDVMTRALCEAAEKGLGVTMVIKNVPGAEATLGVSELKHAAGNGYTVGVATLSGLSMSPHTMKLQYTLDDFSYLLAFGRYDYAIAIPVNSPVKTVDGFVKWAKERDKPPTFSALGLPPQLVAYQLGALKGLQFAHVPYKTGPEALLAMLGGHVDFAVPTPYSASPRLKSNDVRLLATASQRWPIAKDVPSLKELGYNIDVFSYMVLIISKKVSKEREDILFKAFRKAYDDPKFQDLSEKFMTTTPAVERDNLKKILYAKYEEYGKVFQSLGMGKK
ncbi:MAG TPA: tripartite tricarboxylate transporter substrate binding protein [Candidatus Binatia bacterium]|nr:tripartite tricarboxylate transporter substrate binding protein [Candidatus Binatia bacterium]